MHLAKVPARHRPPKLPTTVNAKLVCQDPLASPREITLASFPCEIGRGPAADLRIDDRWISRRHCEIVAVDGKLLVRDLGSRHGTFVNGQSVVESLPLHSGDNLCVGLTHFVAHYEVRTSQPRSAMLARTAEACLA